MLEYALRAFGSPEEKKVRKAVRSGMHFTLTSHAHALGALTTLRMEGMAGFVRMEGLVFVPLSKDMPLLAAEKLKAMGNYTLLLELYDTQLGPVDLSPLNAVKAQYTALKEKPGETGRPGGIRMAPSLRKVGNRRDDKKLEELGERWLAAYLEALKTAPECDPAVKGLKGKEYADRLLKRGGPVIEQLRNTLGEEDFTALMREVVFGVEE